MAINPNDLRIGAVFRRDGKTLKVLDKQHVKLSKGGACQQVKCMDMLSGGISEIRINVTESLEDVYIFKKSLTYSYSDSDLVYFMNTDCEMMEVKAEDLGEIRGLFDNDGTAEFEVMPKIEMEYYEDEKGKEHLINVRLVDDIAVKIIETRPSIKGEAAKAGTKPAVAQGGIKLKVPPHVNTGDMVVLSKNDLSYVSKK